MVKQQKQLPFGKKVVSSGKVDSNRSILKDEKWPRVAKSSKNSLKWAKSRPLLTIGQKQPNSGQNS